MKVLSCGNQLHPDVSSLDKGDYSDKHCIEGFFFFFTFNKLFLQTVFKPYEGKEQKMIH